MPRFREHGAPALDSEDTRTKQRRLGAYGKCYFTPASIAYMNAAAQEAGAPRPAACKHDWKL